MKEFLQYAATWMDLKNIMPSKMENVIQVHLKMIGLRYLSLLNVLKGS